MLPLWPIQLFSDLRVGCGWAWREEQAFIPLQLRLSLTMSLYFLSFVCEPLSAGILNLFAVSGQGMQLLLDRTWICPENGDAGLGVGLGLGVGGLQHWKAARDHTYICTAAPRGVLDTRPGPAPSLPLHPQSWAPPHLDSFLPGGGDQYPGPPTGKMCWVWVVAL